MRIGEQQARRDAGIEVGGRGREHAIHDAPLDARGNDGCEPYDFLAGLAQPREARQYEIPHAARNADASRSWRAMRAGIVSATM